jgi:hypothetical protein
MNKVLVIALLSLIALFAIATLNNIFSNVMAFKLPHLENNNIFYTNDNNYYPSIIVLL